MKKFFAILTAAVLVVACGGGTNTKTKTQTKTQTVEDQLLEYVAKMEKAVKADNYEEAENIYFAYEEWVSSLNEEQMEELIKALDKDVESFYILDEVGASAYSEDVIEVNMVYSNSFDGYLNVRAQASSKSQIVGRLPNGPEGAVLLSDEGKWTKVLVDGVEGYVWSASIQRTPTDPVYINASEVIGEWCWSNGSKINGYSIMDNGTTEYMLATHATYGEGTWYLSYDNLILKDSDGNTTVCTLENNMLHIDGFEYEKID